MVTQQEAKEMRDAIKLLEQTETQQAQAQEDSKIQIALAWFNSLNITIPTTRNQALDNFNEIKQLLETETDVYRLAVLRKKLIEANEKYKEVKKLG